MQVLDWLQANPDISGVAYVLLVTLVMAIGIPGGNVLVLTGGLLFGAWLGAALAISGLVLGAMLTQLLIASTVGRWLQHRASSSGELPWHHAWHENALLLVLPRLVPVIPFFVINVSYACMGVPRWTYFWTTLVGVVPLVTLIARIGSRFSQLEDLSGVHVMALLLSRDLLIPLALLALLTVAGWLLLHRHHRKSA